MSYKYSTPAQENQARAVGTSLPVSTKQAREVCAWLRGRPVGKAKQMLAAVIQAKLAVPFKRYCHNVGHRHGMAAGRYPGKTAGAILTILESAEANAQFKGLSGDLVVRHIHAQIGPTIPRGGRRRKEGKRTHVEIVLQTAAKQEKKARRAARSPKTEVPKAEAKKA